MKPRKPELLSDLELEDKLHQLTFDFIPPRLIPNKDKPLEEPIDKENQV